MVELARCFLAHTKTYRVVKNCLHFVIRIKLTRNSTISCILFKIRIMMLCSHNNTTCGWIWSLFSDVYKNVSGRTKNICPRFVTRIKLTRNSTIGCTSGFGCVWMTLIKPWKSRFDSSISCILFKIRIMVLCPHNNTTYGWTRSLFSGMYRKICLGVKMFVRISSSTQKRPRIQP